MHDETNKELKRGQKAAEAIVEHMKVMGSSMSQWLIPDEKGMWEVKVQLMSFEEKQ